MEKIVSGNSWEASVARGERSEVEVTGYHGVAVAIGSESRATASGKALVAVAEGMNMTATAIATARGSVAVTMNNGRASAGDGGVAVALGHWGHARAGKGGLIVLSHPLMEPGVDRQDARELKSALVGEGGLKAGVFYRLDDKGNFMEAEEQ